MRVIARLKTACGAVRDVELDHLTTQYCVPMMPSRRYATFSDTDKGLTICAVPPIQVRRFNLENCFHYADGIIAEYREELCV